MMKGFIGWYMVRSGLDEKTMANTNEPRVSQYRLAMHLGMAFAVFSGLFYNALSHLLVENPVCNWSYWIFLYFGFLTGYISISNASLEEYNHEYFKPLLNKFFEESKDLIIYIV